MLVAEKVTVEQAVADLIIGMWLDDDTGPILGDELRSRIDDLCIDARTIVSALPIAVQRLYSESQELAGTNIFVREDVARRLNAYFSA